MSEELEYPHLSSTLFGNTDCMEKVRFHLSRVPQYGEGDDTIVTPAKRGTRLHKELEKYYHDELYVPDFCPVTERQDEAAFWRVADELERVRPLVIFSEGEFIKQDENLRMKGILDLVLEDYEGNVVVVDYKFPGKKWNDQKFADYVTKQAYIYMWFMEPRVIRLEYWVCPLNNPNDFKIWTVEYNWEDVQRNLDIWKSTDAHIRSAISFPIMFQPNPSWSACKFCNWRHVCPSSMVKVVEK